MSHSISLKFTLTRHTKAVNALAISPQGTYLLSAGNDSRVVVWNLSTGEMVQELCIPSAGYVSCLAWVKLSDPGEDGFVFGASDGNIHLYQRSGDSPLFSFSSITIAHAGAIEALAWDAHNRRLASVGAGELRIWKTALSYKSFVSFNVNANVKQSYVARSVHFTENGSSVLVCYLESGHVLCYSVDPWDLKWQKKTNGRIGDSHLDGQQLLVSNLRDGVDKYMIPTLHQSQSYHHSILVNVPLQLTVARESGILILGGDSGFVRIFDYQSGAFREKLEHGNAGDLVPVVTSFEGPQGCIIVTGSSLDGHSNIKVWTHGYQVSKPATEARTSSGLTGKQFMLLALLCILVNLVMAYFPRRLPLAIPDTLSLVPENWK